MKEYQLHGETELDVLMALVDLLDPPGLKSII